MVRVDTHHHMIPPDYRKALRRAGIDEAGRGALAGPVVAAAVVLGIALAYVPMKLVVSQIARNVVQFIQRQRDRRRVARGTPDRRKEASP